MSQPLVSIVINTLNRGKVLGDTLSSLKGLAYPSFEVIVVNGPSTDNTQQIIDGWGSAIKACSCAEPNLSISRNVGIEAAAGDIVAFIDDDAAPHPDWLSELVKPYVDPRVGGVGGFTIDNTGVRYQARKTICDRFGNAHYVSPFFDERPLCFPGTPHFPSLLGTNSSFRRSVLREIGGFDHVFAYLLDETDVCLRIVDAGHAIHYAPKALVFHQFSESHIRTQRRIPKTLYPSVVSKSYFIMRHGARQSIEKAARELEAYRAELTRANKWLHDHSDITAAHRASLDQDLAWGIERGSQKGAENIGRKGADLDLAKEPLPARPFPTATGLRLALVSQSFPPANEAGIARWTSMMAEGLAARGHVVHVIARAGEHASVRYEKGYWLHRILPDPARGEALMANQDLPPNIAAWAAAVRTEVATIKSFGLDAVSFPIWDLEGVALLDDPDVGVLMSLHTTYAMARPFKPEWQARPLYDHFMVAKMIRAERELVARLPVILANSEAIVADLTESYGVAFADRAVVAPHGTADPLEERPERRGLREQRGGGFQVAFVGRFEPRKGIDIAAAAIARLIEAREDATAVFVGDTLTPAALDAFAEAGASQLIDNPRVTFKGLVSRSELDDIYATVDAVLMPSRYESFGLVAIEAMAAGAAVVALAAGGLKEVVEHGKTGYLVAVDGKAAETCADHLIALARTPALRESMGQAARAAFESRFTVEAMVAAAEPAYRRVAKGGRGLRVVERGAGRKELQADDRDAAAGG